MTTDDDGVFVYVGVRDGLRVAVVVDSPEHTKSIAKTVSGWIRAGYIVHREPMVVFREKRLASFNEIHGSKQVQP